MYCTHHVALYVQFFAYKMTEASENSMLKHRNLNLNTVTVSDCTAASKTTCYVMSCQNETISD
jgi:hypothetical protein